MKGGRSLVFCWVPDGTTINTGGVRKQQPLPLFYRNNGPQRTVDGPSLVYFGVTQLSPVRRLREQWKVRHGDTGDKGTCRLDKTGMKERDISRMDISGITSRMDSGITSEMDDISDRGTGVWGISKCFCFV